MMLHGSLAVVTSLALATTPVGMRPLLHTNQPVEGEEEELIIDEDVETETVEEAPATGEVPSPVMEEEEGGSDPMDELVPDPAKIEQAKVLFAEGQAALEAEDYPTALSKFEQAYNDNAPHLHVFNFNIGNAALFAGDCVKAKAAFERFLQMVPEHVERPTAEQKLREIEASGCARPPPTVAVVQPKPAPVIRDKEAAPMLESRRSARERDDDLITQERKLKQLKVSGATFVALGAATLGGSLATFLLARQIGNDLATLAQPSTLEWPDGDYSTDEVFNKQTSELPTMNTVTVALLAGGGALTTLGIGLLVGYAVKKRKMKKGEDEEAKARPAPSLTGVGLGLLPSGAGASASIQF